MFILDLGASLKTLKWLSWVWLSLNIVLSGITFLIAKGDNTPLAAVNILVPILVLIYTNPQSAAYRTPLLQALCVPQTEVYQAK